MFFSSRQGNLTQKKGSNYFSVLITPINDEQHNFLFNAVRIFPHIKKSVAFLHCLPFGIPFKKQTKIIFVLFYFQKEEKQKRCRTMEMLFCTIMDLILSNPKMSFAAIADGVKTHLNEYRAENLDLSMRCR